jgi:glycosyltransferase involved in cell wall biosynthesis
MATGLACVTTEVGSGTSWVVQDGVTGRVVPPRDPAALAAAIKPLIEDVALRKQFGQAGLRRARETFSVHHLVERVLGVYEAVLH